MGTRSTTVFARKILFRVLTKKIAGFEKSAIQSK